MPSARPTDVQDVINAHPVSGFQKLVITLCFLVVAIDGFDTAAVGFIAPALRAEWGVTPAQLAPLFGAGLFGLMAGAFVFGPLADRWAASRCWWPPPPSSAWRRWPRPSRPRSRC